MTLGRMIRTLRTAVGFNQKEFAASLDISPAYLSQLESDKREPTISLLGRIASKLGSPAAIFLVAAIASKLPPGEREREMEALENLVEALRLNLTSKQLALQLFNAS